MESWAAALAIAQLAQEGEQENGVDRALIEAFGGRTITELEGAAAQLAIFDRLPEKEQRDLLDAVVTEASSNDAAANSMLVDWSRGELKKLERSTARGILADPELRDALLIRRNQAWATKLEKLLGAKERPLVAVGAGHMVGSEGLPSLLEEAGYEVVRVE